ncbi:hypothetical protein [Pseudomonas sp. TCU-HL1]|uniref:hypothetical protein n=1 Tax=Pseudomonas sp. TCU-HL1 TaxID=1856685 RepID=UPI00083D1ACE|nr:hypothetical protein [Pseudomonas sp. TCU-HL1]AOE88110.1 hypothetical protein THL1_5563 [Pseudomonas sp. TCU-HL1]
MDDYLDLDRRFSLLTNYTNDELFASGAFGKRLPWSKVLEGRFSIIVARANFGKTMELKAKSMEMRREGHPCIYVALHKVLGEALVEDALDAEDGAAFDSWKREGGSLTAFVDSLDEASLGTEDGIRKALKRLGRAMDWPNADIRWVLSSRPAVLTEEVLTLLQSELRTMLHTGVSDDDEFDLAFAQATDSQSGECEVEQQTGAVLGDMPSLGDLKHLATSSKIESKPVPGEQLKLFALLPLDDNAAERYLRSHLKVAHANDTLNVARLYGLARLTEGPGGLDILAYIDPVQNPPQHLTQVLEKVVGSVQHQQRADPRENRIGNPLPESLDEAIGRLACASTMCQLPNIEISSKALRYREGVLSARPLIASVLSEQSLAYLLGSRLFIDSGQHQVKIYPDDLLPFLAAKRLASLVRSPDHARRLLATFTWNSTTGECGVHRSMLPVAGWLAVFSSHCRQVLLNVEPQAVAFFGDLRNPCVLLHEASLALERAIKRLVSAGDTLGRGFYTLTAENYWQAAKPGIGPTLQRLFDTYNADWHAKSALLEIASHSRLELFRDAILAGHESDYARLLDDQLDLNYILALERDDDYQALGAALKTRPDLPESRATRLVAALAWKALDAKSIAEIAATQFNTRRGGFSIDWVLTGHVARKASNTGLYKLTRSLLLRLIRINLDVVEHWGAQKHVELVMDLLALVIKRSAVESSRTAHLCLVLNRYVNEHHFGTADMVKLQSALTENNDVRLAFLRGLVHSTDRNSDGIWRAVFGYCSIYQYIAGDEVLLGEPGFVEVITSRTSAPAVAPRRSDKTGRAEPKIDSASRDALLHIVDGIRDASKVDALAWVAQWLYQTSAESRYSECNFAVFERAAGREISQAVRMGLSTLWRTKDPIWKEDEPHSTFNITIAGLQGLHLDIGDGSKISALSEPEVRLAIRYARFELNGYPKWFWSLVAAHEQAASDELRTFLVSADKGQVSLEKAEVLVRYLDEAPLTIQQRLAGAVWNFVVSNTDISEYTTEAALKIAISNDEYADQENFEREAWRRMETSFDVDPLPLTGTPTLLLAEGQDAQRRFHRERSNAIVWGSFWLWAYPGTFSEMWNRWKSDKAQAAERFMLALAAHLGENRGARLREVAEKGTAGLTTLKTLYEWVRSVVREEDDIVRDGGDVFTPGERDHAQRLREALVPAISHAKSEQAYEILQELQLNATGPRAKYLRYMQFMMREEQFATTPIAQTEYFEFERSFAPRISTYVEFAMAIETDLLTAKSQIETGEFSLRRFFNLLTFNRIKSDNEGLALEEDFQALLGSELNHTAGGRYTVTLESILPEGTRRDVLCQSGTLRATVELKMSVRWTLNDYLQALKDQLQGQYMMAPNSKIGFFIVVLQKKRKWKSPEGKWIGFDEVIAILKNKAREEEIKDSSVFLRVIGIDASPKEDFRESSKNQKTKIDSATTS